MIDQNNMGFISVLKHLSESDWAAFGVNNYAYLKPIVSEGQNRYAIHAADGTPLAVMDTKDIAYATIVQNELEPVSVH